MMLYFGCLILSKVIWFKIKIRITIRSFYPLNEKRMILYRKCFSTFITTYNCDKIFFVHKIRSFIVFGKCQLKFEFKSGFMSRSEIFEAVVASCSQQIINKSVRDVFLIFRLKLAIILWYTFPWPKITNTINKVGKNKCFCVLALWLKIFVA